MQLYIRVHMIILKWNLILSIWIFFFNKILSLSILQLKNHSKIIVTALKKAVDKKQSIR